MTTTYDKDGAYIEVTTDGVVHRRSIKWADCIVSVPSGTNLKVDSVYVNESDQLVLVLEDESEVIMSSADDLSTHDTDIKVLLAIISAYIDTEIATILAAVDTEVAAIEVKLDTPANFMADVTALALEATLTAIKGGGWSTQTLVAIKTAIDAIPTTMVGTDNAATESKQDIIDGVVDDILADTAALEIASAKQLFTMDFWSLSQEEVALTIAAGDKALPSVTVADLPAGVTIVRAIAMFKFRMIENHTYAGVNSLDGAQEIQVATSVDAINFVTGQFTLAQDTREGGDVIIGVIDIAATVNANGAYAFHWDLAKALQTGINFNDVQMGIRIWYSV